MSTRPLSYAWTVLAAVLVAFAGALLLALPASLPTSDAFAQGAKPAKDQAAKKDEPWHVNDDVDDPAVWGKVFPLHFELYLKTVDMQRTKYGGSSCGTSPGADQPRAEPASQAYRTARIRLWLAGVRH